MTEDDIENHISSREVYRRTDIIILHNDEQEYAVVAVQRKPSEGLFNRVDKVEVLALPEDCVYLESPETDPANRSALAKLAVDNNVSSDRTAIVMGTFDHVNVIHRPDPMILRVAEVVPPEPPKLYHMVEQVLGYADLPPIVPRLEQIELVDLCKSVRPEAYLVPCRSGGLDNLGAPVYFLDERPEKRENWTLVGCERSLQFHRHYYGDEPPQVEMCPRRIVNKSGVKTILKCCLLEFGIEQEGELAVVPWGADLSMVEQALREVSQGVEYA
ncbi:MAG: hypothetical protein OXI88_18240 [Gammaproteobacteria bacterium]|nr:hypothetical protein [Gammaproteobacteria bacterium]MDE0513710.1 hypothetical protein [Gammaproteobacteria bacterium]